MVSVGRDAFKRVGASIALTAFVVAQTVMIRYSRNEEGKLPYNPTAANFVNELVKLFVSSLLWYTYDRKSTYNGLNGVNPRTFALYSVPGLIYAVQNSLIFYALLYLEAPTFQVFASLKIVTTAILFRLILRKILTYVQWVALFQLFLSMIITKMGALLNEEQQTEQSKMLIGASILLFNSCLSAVSGITNEYLVKNQDKKAPLMIKSMQLYAWGSLINLVGWILTDQNEINFKSFTPLVWCIILNNAAVGLSVAFIMKYADNIVKCFSTAAAVFISALISSALFDFPLDIPFATGLVLYSTAFYLYFGSHNAALKSAHMDDSEFWLCPPPLPENEAEEAKIDTAVTANLNGPPPSVALRDMEMQNVPNHASRTPDGPNGVPKSSRSSV
ncbi:hypothetical protein AAMO2058_000410900 [Amorphochlora amoebiformis]